MGRASADDVSGLKQDDGGDVAEHSRNIEDEVARLCPLHDFAVDGEAEIEAVWIGQFIGGYNAWAEGTEGG
jgi:hypothetical protein